MNRKLIAVALAGLIAGSGVAEDKAVKPETWDGSVPTLFALTFLKSGHADSAKLESTLAELRKGYEEKDILFLRIDVSTRASRHQSKLLLNALAIESDVWKTAFAAPGVFKIVDADTGEARAEFNHKKTAKEIKKGLDAELEKPREVEEEEEPEGDEDGMD
ncbi:MAG: hypothetical protein ACYTHK_08615 [Planctomycetota bacterium]|jgi:hypothetical protein